jgi:hypothetical protein
VLTSSCILSLPCIMIQDIVVLSAAVKNKSQLFENSRSSRPKNQSLNIDRYVFILYSASKIPDSFMSK